MELKFILGGKKVKKTLAKIKGSSSADGGPAISDNLLATSTTANSSNDGQRSQQLSIDDLGKVYVAVQEACCQWYDIGVELRVSANDLDAIKESTAMTPKTV